MNLHEESALHNRKWNNKKTKEDTKCDSYY